MKARASRASRPTTAAMMSLFVSTAPDEAVEVLERWLASWACSTVARTCGAADAAVATRPTRARDADAARPINVALRRCSTLHRLPFAEVRECRCRTPSLPRLSDNDPCRDLLRPLSQMGVAPSSRFVRRWRNPTEWWFAVEM